MTDAMLEFDKWDAQCQAEFEDWLDKKEAAEEREHEEEEAVYAELMPDYFADLDASYEG